MKPITTERLRLIPLDSEMLHLALSDHGEMEAALGLSRSEEPPSISIREAMRIKLMKMASAPKDLHPWYTYWIIVLEETNRRVGMLGFKGAPDHRNEVEIGYGLDEDSRKKGYATEAVQALVRWAMQNKDGISVIAETRQNNILSQNVLKRVGFERYRETPGSIWWRMDREGDNR